MPRWIGELTETGLIAEMRAELRRLWRAVGSNQGPVGEYDEYTLSSSSDAAHTLAYIPSLSLIPIACLNGLPGRYGTDYTVNFTTGVVTWSATKVAGDILGIFYQTTGDLVALSGTADSGKSFNVASTATATSSTIAVFVDSAAQVGDLLIFAAAGYASSGITADPTGWTRIGVARGTGTSIPIDVGVWWKIATSGDIGAVSSAATFPNSDQHIGIILAYSGYSAVRSSTLSGGSVAAGSSITTPTLSATSGDAVISLWAGEGDASPAPAFTIDAADTSRANVAMNFPRLMLGDEIAAGGTTTARTVSVAGGGNVSWASAQIAIY